VAPKYQSTATDYTGISPFTPQPAPKPTGESMNSVLNLEAAVYIPKRQATETALMTFPLYLAGAVSLAAVAGVLSGLVWGWTTGLVAGAIALFFGVCLSVIGALYIRRQAWTSGTGDWWAIVERLSGLDINQDGVIGIEPAQVFEVWVRQDNGNHQTRVTLPGGPEKFAELAREVVKSGSYTTRLARAVYGDTLYTPVQAELIGRGMIIMRNPKAPQQGFDITRGGQSLFRTFARPDALTTPPSPGDEEA
jgi:hypothetical protein